jgi:hypothetical protein
LGLTPKGIGAGTHQNDVQGFKLATDAVQLMFQILDGDALTVRFGAEIQQHTVLEAPLFSL